MSTVCKGNFIIIFSKIVLRFYKTVPILIAKTVKLCYPYDEVIVLETYYEDLQTLHSISPTNPIVFDKRLYSSDDTFHWHENIEILYFLNGECNVLNGDEILRAQTGDIIVLNSGAVHGVMCKNSPAEFICIIIDHQFCETMGFSVTDTVIAKKINDTTLGELIEKIAAEPKTDNPLFQQSITVTTLSVLLLLFKNYVLDEIRGDDSNTKTRLVKDIVKYIKRNYKSSISMADLEEHCGYSRYHLSKVFKEVTNKTVMGYLENVRIGKAKELLLNTTLDINTISAECGFDCQSYFGKVFKKSEGCSPLAFRNKRRT